MWKKLRLKSQQCWDLRSECVCAGGCFTLSVGCTRMALGLPLASLPCSEGEEVDQ